MLLPDGHIEMVYALLVGQAQIAVRCDVLGSYGTAVCTCTSLVHLVLDSIFGKWARSVHQFLNHW
jgi:hypothetical protein